MSPAHTSKHAAASIATSLAKYPSNHLKLLAKLTGLNTTATKASLAQALSTELFQPPRRNALQNSTKSTTAMRVLSIDMGIRNLAFCVLEIEPGRQHLQQPTQSLTELSETDITQSMPSILSALNIIAWKRTSLYDLLDPTTASPTTTPPNQQQQQDKSDKLTQTKEAFDPATFASLTYKLVTRVFLPYNISHVLIERQRHRSSSAPAVMEWTVRVNMLESMLHAVFRTLRNEVSDTDGGDEGADVTFSTRWGFPIPAVHSTSPRKVGQFWEGVMPLGMKGVGESGGKLAPRAGGKKVASKVEKEEKIAIAAALLDPEDAAASPLRCSAKAEGTAAAFLAVRAKQMVRRNGGSRHDAATSRRRTASLGEDQSRAVDSSTKLNTKLDDLADCLLQGTAWVQWEANRLFLRDWIARSEAAKR